MKYLTWMVVFGIVVLAVANVPVDNTHTYYIDYFELNHSYDTNGNFILDQVILWEWVEYYDVHSKYILKAKVVDWYLVKYREKLTDAEFAKRNREFANQWIKRLGRMTNQIIPKYVPPFVGGIEVPRYDYDRNCWKVMLLKKNFTIVIYGRSFMETWTQADPEVANRQVFSVTTRKNYLRKTQ